MEFKDALRRRREALRMTPDQLAASLTHYGAPASSADVQLWERGRNVPPLESPAFQEALAASLQIPVEKIRGIIPIHKREPEPESEYSHAALEAAALVDRMAPGVRTVALELLRTLERGAAGWRFTMPPEDPWA